MDPYDENLTATSYGQGGRALAGVRLRANNSVYACCSASNGIARGSKTASSWGRNLSARPIGSNFFWLGNLQLSEDCTFDEVQSERKDDGSKEHQNNDRKRESRC